MRVNYIYFKRMFGNLKGQYFHNNMGGVGDIRQKTNIKLSILILFT